MKKEQGAVMIIVLIVLLLVAIAGVVAMRSGIFGSRLAMNNQIGGLLLHDSDSALGKFESMSKDDVVIAFAQGGVYRHLLDPANATDELVFCYDANQDDIFNITHASIIKENDTTSGTKFCTHQTFSSGRGTHITQVHMRRNPAETQVKEGSTVSVTVPTVEDSINLSLTTISVLPTASSTNVDTAKIDECLKKTAFKKKNTTQTNAECFADLGVPHEVQSTDYESGNAITVQRS